jgi:hypothetical protein
MTAVFISFEISLLPEGAKLYKWVTDDDGCKRWVEDTAVFKKYICDKYQATYVIAYFLVHSKLSTNNIINYKSLWYKSGLFYAEVDIPHALNNNISDDTIEELIIPPNRNHLTIDDNNYNLHVNLCNYQDYDSDELLSLSNSTDDVLEQFIDYDDFYNTDANDILEIPLKDNDSDDCCDKQCISFYSWMSQLLSNIFTYPNKTVNNKYNKNA